MAVDDVEGGSEGEWNRWGWSDEEWLSANGFLGAARNEGVRRSRGSLVMFMDDDNVAMPDEVERFVSVFVHGERHVDVLTCHFVLFNGTGSPPASVQDHSMWMPLGGAVAVGSLRNALGDANFMVRRSGFEVIGGFSTDRFSFQDYEFLASAVLGGYAMQVVPQALFWKRDVRDSMIELGDSFEDLQLALRPYERSLPWQLFQPIQLAHSPLRLTQDAQLLASSVHDFHSQQGHRGWLYGYMVGEAQQQLVPLPAARSTETNKLTQSYGYTDPVLSPWCTIDQYQALPCVLSTATRQPVTLVRRWQCSEVGAAIVHGEVSRWGKCGDGVLFTMHNGTHTLLQQRLSQTHPTAQVFEVLQLHIGLAIDFRVHPLADQDCDSVWMHLSITKVDLGNKLAVDSNNS